MCLHVLAPAIIVTTEIFKCPIVVVQCTSITDMDFIIS